MRIAFKSFAGQRLLMAKPLAGPSFSRPLSRPFLMSRHVSFLFNFEAIRVIMGVELSVCWRSRKEPT